MDTAWIVLLTLTCVSALEINKCNQTISKAQYSDLTSDFKVTFKQSHLQHIGKPYYCWYRFEGSKTQYVEVDVVDLVAGQYESNQCEKGYMRITDDDVEESSLRWLPPTTLCGDYENSIRVKRYTRGSSAFVEFRVDNAEPSQSFEFDATFLDKEPEETLPYGHIQRSDGKINSTLCDWLVPADTCFGSCILISPGHSGIYPPNIKCRYTIINFDDGRVQVKFGGKHSTRFDLKRSEDCKEDHLAVYDGRSSDDPLIGRYCGLDSDFIISSGTSLYMEFISGPGGPPYDYTGFTVKVQDRWKNEHDNGQKVSNTLCDWTFRSRDSMEGDLHTPDHMVDPGTTCLYTFTGQPGEVLEIRVKAYELSPDCRETVEVLDGDHLLDRICADRIKSRRSGASFTFTSTHHEVVVRYNTLDKRLSSPRPMFIYYTFMKRTDDVEEYIQSDDSTEIRESPQPTKVSKSSNNPDGSDSAGYRAKSSAAHTRNVMMGRDHFVSFIITLLVAQVVLRS